MTDLDTTGYVNLGAVLAQRWPSFLPQFQDESVLDRVWAGALDTGAGDAGVRGSTRLLFDDELVLSIPGCDAVSLAVAAEEGGTVLPLEVRIEPEFGITIADVPLALRLSGDLLRPARNTAPAGHALRYEADPTRDHLDVRFDGVTVSVDGDGDLAVDADAGFDLPPCMIGDSGIVIEAHDVRLHLDAKDPPPGQAAGWKGLHIGHAALHLPGELAATVGILELTDCFIGNGGFTGGVSDTWMPALPAALFGLDFTLGRVEIEFVQNAPVACELAGTVTLPFFDQPVGVDLAVGLDGSFGITLSAAQPPGVDGAGGLITFSKPGILTVGVDSLGFTLEDGLFTTTISGTIRPEIAGIDWPDFAVRELSIDSAGNVRLDGGWLDLPDQYSIDFFGFQIDVTRLGFGRADDGGRWVGFSGGIKLVDGLTAGASVDGLRITWDDGGDVRISLDGVGVELNIPGTLRFSGEVSYRELPGGVHRFDGDIELDLIALDLQIDGKIVVGSADDGEGGTYTFFALYVGVELPAGIPLFGTGLGLYGIAGLIAIDMAPNKGLGAHEGEEWYENAGGGDGWYKRPDVGVTDLATKWDPREGAFALGAGVTIGTVADNGFTFNGKVLLVVSLPGPVILIEGKANMLKERASLDDDPIFRALAVLDFNEGTFLVGLDAAYKVGSGGELIDIGASAEFYFSLADALAWHLYVGRKDPRERRVRAEILTLFKADSYFMIDATALQTGAWVGYDKHWRFGPLTIDVEAWLDGGVLLSFKPVYFHGELWLHGRVALKIFGFGLGLQVDARFEADVFDPFHVLAEFTVRVELPWFLPDFEVGLTLEWGPTPDRPPLPVPLKEIAVEHFKASASWPLPRGSLLLPDRDDGSGFLVLPPAPADDAPAPAGRPVVPVDSRPHVTFGRAVHDDALVGVNPQPVLPAANPPGWERIGDPATGEGPMRVRYSLREVALSKWTGETWALVARKATDPNPAGVPTLYGSWAPVPALPTGVVAPGSDPPIDQVKLWLWSRTPFDFTSHGGKAWDEWFTDAFAGYPCVPPPPSRRVCCDVAHLPPGPRELPLPCPHDDGIVLTGGAEVTVTQLPEPVGGQAKALCWTPGVSGEVDLQISPATATRVDLYFAVRARPARTCLSLREGRPGPTFPLPLHDKGFTVSLVDANGTVPAHGLVHTVEGISGLELLSTARIDLPCPADAAEVTVARFGGPVTATATDADGVTVAVAQAVTQGAPEVLLLEGPGIVSVWLKTPQNQALLLEVCATCPPVPFPARAYGVQDDGIVHGPFLPDGDVITVPVERLSRVEIRADQRVCLARWCVTFAPDAEQVKHHQEMAEHLQAATAHFAGEGEVLEPHTTYRVTVRTGLEAVGEGPLSGVDESHDLIEHAYLRTEGPPTLTALSTPVNHPAGEPFDSGLTDLARYVDHSVPGGGGRSLVPTRPVYRAYDVGVVFNEDYVDLMYRMARRDLTLRLHDVNGRPVRDPGGDMIVEGNRWGHVENVALTDGEKRYVTVIDGVTCVVLDENVVPRNRTLFSAGDGHVLDADTGYEARLTPLLLHEDFTGGLAGWEVVDQGTVEAPSAWATVGHPTLSGDGATSAGDVVTLTAEVSQVEAGRDVVVLATDTARPGKTYLVLAVDPALKTVQVDGEPALSGGTSAWKVPAWGRLHQTAGIWGGSGDPIDPAMPGTMLLTGDGTWADYRLSVLVRPVDDGPVGVVFRCQGPQSYYRFSVDRRRGLRRLVRVAGGAHTLLGEDDVRHPAGGDLLLTAEAAGDRLALFVDGEPVFTVTDGALAHGRIGLYCWANEDARWSDVRVDDLSAGAPQAHRFAFTTSRYANFFHQIHSHDGMGWAADPGPAAVTALGSAVPVDTPPSDAEQRAFTAFATAALGAAAQPPVRLETTVARVAGDAVALVVRGPEPIDWRRTALSVERADAVADRGSPPVAVKLAELDVTGPDANEETLTVLAQGTVSPAGYVVEQLRPPGPLGVPDDTVYVEDLFDGPERGVVHDEVFGPAALSRYTIVDEPGAVGTSEWAVGDGAIVQTSNIFGGDESPLTPDKPGTIALTGGSWGDVRISAALRSLDDDAIGLVFRYRGPGDHYRFSMDAERGYRRLIRRADGAVTVLWHESEGYVVGQPYHLEIHAHGDALTGYLDGEPLFDVIDAAHETGQVGLYCWANVGARFEALRVETLERRPESAGPPLEVGGWRIAELSGIPSRWTRRAGALRSGGSAASAAVTGEPSWRDVRVRARLSATDGRIGLIARWAGPGDHYRLVLEPAARRLIKVVDGAASVLWEDLVAGYPPGQTLTLTLDVEGSRLVGHLGEEELFAVTDDDLEAGRAGLYAGIAGRFEEVTISTPPPIPLWRDRFQHGDPAGWTFVDESDTEGPAVWEFAGGELVQTSNAHTTPLDVAARGTHAVAGHVAWRDVLLTVRLRSEDDDAIGVLFRHTDSAHYYRFSMDSERGYRRLVKNVGGVVTVLWQDGVSFEPGRTYEITVSADGGRLRGWIDGVPVFVVDDFDLPTGRVGLYCWANVGARFSRVTVHRPVALPWALEDDLDGVGIGGWRFVTAGDIGGPAAFEVVDGELRQTADVRDSAPGADPAKPGALALAGAPGWTDVRVCAQLASDVGRAIGVVFRHATDATWYRFSMDRVAGYRRLVRSVDGVVTVLWQDSSAYVLGRPYLVTIDAIGGTLTGHLNGERLFSVRDDAIPAGRMGLYCWGDPGARFGRAEVAAARWARHHRFPASEPVLPAGTRVAVHSGNAAAWDAGPAAGVVHRFTAELGDQGRQRFGSGAAVRLRLRDPRGDVAHERTVLPASAFAPQPGTRVLRKADGTEFVLTFGAPPTLPAGVYRLRMTYRRDNTATDTGGDVLRQAGDSSDETVVLDVPGPA